MRLRFFCDQCGTEVPRNTVRCPTCGRFFTAVQCPRCHYRGQEQDFASGCPRCGYMRAPPPAGGVAGSRRKGAKRAGRRTPTPALAPVSRRLLRLVGILLAVALVGLLAALFFI